MIRCCIACAAVVMSGVGVARGGDLSPPMGMIESTMKTITEVEPRRILNALPGDSQRMIMITSPGSYYLAADIVATPGKHGIGVAADHVIIDLNGFGLVGDGGFASVGITAIGTRSDFTIRNGRIDRWGYASLNIGGLLDDCVFEDLSLADNQAGAFELAGIDNSIFRNITIKGQGEVGIFAGNNCLITGCTIDGHFSGIMCSLNCVISNCAVTGGGRGIVVVGQSVIERCTVTGASSYGMNIGNGSIARDCSISGCTSGIIVNGFSRVEGCTVSQCTGEGVRISTRTAAVGNHVSLCGSGIATGIPAGQWNVVERNTVVSCSTGIKLSTSANTIVSNTVIGSVTALDIAPGNAVGAQQASPVGAGPWDNIAY